MARLLVIDDDEASCRLVAAIFAKEGLEVVAAADATTGLLRVAENAPDVVILDLRLPDLDGIQVLERIRAANTSLPVVMLTAHSELKTAVRATQLGAFDYLTKPIDPEELTLAVRRALENHALRAEVEDLRKQLGEGGGLAAQMGPSREVGIVVEQVRTVAATTFSVLILGETGTGKELVAQAVHRQSDRRRSALVAVDCGAIPDALVESELFGHEKGAFTGADRRKEGRFQLAEGGTLFLDEVGNLPLGVQAKLLRVLESRQVQPVGAAKSIAADVRVIAATNDDMHARVNAGKFRADLYFRLAQYTITLLPLRERAEDIGYLAQRFLDEVAIELRRPAQRIAPDGIAALQRHRWPGNVRELRNVIRQAVLESRDAVLRRGDLRRLIGSDAAKPSDPAAGRSLREIAETAARDAERQAITDALRATRGNKSRAAKALQTDYKTLHVKMKALGIQAADFTA